MKGFYLLALFFLSFFSLSTDCCSQNSNSKIDFENPDPEFFEDLVFKKLNEYRREKELKTFQKDEVLTESSKYHAKYIFKTNRIDSEEGKRSMANPFLRVNKLGGSHAIVKEANTVIEIGEKTKIKGIRGRQIINTYNEAADAVVTEWLNSKYELEHIDNPVLLRAGIGSVFLPGNKLIYVTADFACDPYNKIEGVDYSKNSYKIRPYSREDCRFFEREYGYLPELFSSSLSIENGEIIFEFHDLNLISSILESRKDGIAVDILMRSQYDCESGNRNHPSKVEKGVLLKPVKKGRLLRKNPLEEQKAFRAVLGTFPESIDPKEAEMNLLIIQDKCNCQTIIYNNINSKNLRLLDLDFTIDTLSISEDVDSLSRQLNFTIPFEKNKSEYQVEDIKPILDSIQLNRYDIKTIEITAYSSIEGNRQSNEVLQQKRAESILSAIQQYQLQQVTTSIKTLENWEGFKKSISQSPYADEYAGKTDEEIREMVNSDTLKYDLEPYLKGQRKADIKIVVESIYIDSLVPEVLPKKFKKAIEDNEYIIARGIQTMMFKNVLKGKMDKEVLFPEFVPYERENMPLMNNVVAFKYMFYDGNDIDSLFEQLKSDITRFHSIEPENPHLNYNKQLIELYYWSVNIHYLMIDEEANINQPKDLYTAIRRLYNSKIDNYKVNQLMLNYHLIAADFYYETQDFKMREKSLKAVKKLVLKSKLDMEQTYLMAGYFMFQIHMDWAIEIMLPFIKEKNYDEDFIFRLISIAPYDEDQISEEKFINLLKIGKKLNSKRFCSLFGAPEMSFQLLENREIKSMYCNDCESGND